MKTREEQIEQSFQNIKNGSLIFAWDFDPYDTPFIVVAKKENDKIYAKIKETNSGAIVLDGWRKQSDIVREFVEKIEEVALQMRCEASRVYQGRNRLKAQFAFGEKNAIENLMEQINEFAAEYGAEVGE